MKKLCLAFSFFFSAWHVEAQTSSGDARVLLGIESHLPEAIAQHNETYLNNLFDDRYHGVTPNGTVVDKARWLELLKTNTPYVVFTVEDVKATIYGQAAVVSGKLVGKSKSGVIIGQTRYIHVFIKHNEQWRIIEEQSTLVLE